MLILLAKISISTIISEDDYQKLWSKNNQWYQAKNTWINKSWKESGMATVSLSRINKGVDDNRKIEYRFLSVTFSGLDSKKINRKYIDTLLKKNLFSSRFPKEYKLSGIIFTKNLLTDFGEEWNRLLKKSFSLNSRGMNRTTSPSGQTIYYRNEDMEIHLRISSFKWPDAIDMNPSSSVSLDQMDCIHISFVLRKGKIQSCIRKYGYKDRTIESMLKVWRDMEKKVMTDYLTAIIGTGKTYSVNRAVEIIKDSNYTTKKKKRLQSIFMDIQKYENIDEFICAASRGDVEHVSNKKSAMDYIRCLEGLDINPIAHTLDDNVIFPDLVSYL